MLQQRMRLNALYNLAEKDSFRERGDNNDKLESIGSAPTDLRIGLNDDVP